MVNSKYFCDVCGREMTRKHKMQGFVLCSKHMHQLHKYGKFLDNIQRTNNDLNAYVIKGDVAIFDLYNQKNLKVAEFMIDTKDLKKVKYHKWRLNHGHVVTGTKQKGNVQDLSWLILGIKDISDNVVDHINHNPLDNREANLRVCKQFENAKNSSLSKNNSSGFVGVYWNKERSRWISKIKVNYKHLHLGQYKTLEEAVYARMLAEDLYFGDFKNIEEYNKKKQFTCSLSKEKKTSIKQKTTKRHERYKNLAYKLHRT